MFITRRGFAASAAALGACATFNSETSMYGLIGKMRAKPGQRGALTAILLAGADAMPGCRTYIVAHDAEDADAVWITEVWDNADQHRASLQLPQVQAAIAQARPLIAGFDEHHEIVPVGGIGLARS
jgi:quinol monooxygenase YgiN